jgi:two-component system KDP operon response regulator KdpE
VPPAPESAAAPPQILVIEDDRGVRTVIRAKLVKHGYRVLEAETAKEGLEHARAYNPDAVILDLGLPDQDGMEVTRAIRAWSPMPIVVVSARGQESDKVDVLDAGADDYVTKPFGDEELLARLRVALRHAARAGAPSPSLTLKAGDLTVDLGKRVVLRAGQPVHLTPLQYKLLVELMKGGGKVVTQRQLLAAVWGPGHVKDSHYLRIYMGQLRQKLEKNPARPEYIVTDPGVGYRILMDDELG